MTDAGISQIIKTDPVREPTTPSAEYPPPAAAINSPREATSAQKETTITTPPEQLWDQAYDDLKRDEPKLFDLYETILSHDLDSSKGAKGNVIEQMDRTKRRAQMEGLLNTGLDNTAKLAKAEKKVGDAMKIVLSVKEAIGSGLQAVPIAALTWTGICVALEASTPSQIQSVIIMDNASWHRSANLVQMC
jgi:hypothetical protein